jgi:hypothetical protein
MAYELWVGLLAMLYRTLISSFLVAGAFAFASTASAQTSAVQGEVRGIDGHRMQGAQIRIERKDQKSALITTTTDARGHYATNKLPLGVYRISVVGADGTVMSSANVKTAASNARLDFDLKPTATKKIKHYVWMAPSTGSRVGGVWVEADSSGTPIARMLNTDTVNSQGLQELMRRATPNITTH